MAANGPICSCNLLSPWICINTYMYITTGYLRRQLVAQPQPSVALASQAGSADRRPGTLFGGSSADELVWEEHNPREKIVVLGASSSCTWPGSSS